MTTPAPWTEQVIGHTLAGRYQIDALLGEGATGVVFRGHHTWTDRPVAIKVLRPEVIKRDATLVKRFFREAKATASLPHKHVVDVLDMGEESGLAFLVLELLDGEELSVRLAREPVLDLETSLRIVLPIVSALQAAHDRGLIHRDVKAENIFLHHADGHLIPKLLDFGTVKMQASDVSRLTAKGSILGTPHYMAVEQILGKPLTPACDQVAIGALLFRMLSGRFPFENVNVTTVLADIVMKPVPALLEHAPTVPPGVSRIVGKAMAKQPEERFADMHSLLEALLDEAAEAGLPLGRPSSS
jgi:serine/threonine protein kinase